MPCRKVLFLNNLQIGFAHPAGMLVFTACSLMEFLSSGADGGYMLCAALFLDWPGDYQAGLTQLWFLLKVSAGTEW